MYDHNLEHGAALKKVANTARPRDAAEGAAPRAPLQQRNPSAENPLTAAGAARARGGARPQPTSPDALDTWMGATATASAGGAAERQRRFSQADGGDQQHRAGPRYRLDGGTGYGERAGYEGGRAEPERAAPGSFGDPRAYGLPGADAEQQLRELSEQANKCDERLSVAAAKDAGVEYTWSEEPNTELLPSARWVG